MADLEALKNAVIKGDEQTAKDVTSKALAEGVKPEMILNQGLIAGMDVVGAAFKNCEMFLPEVLFAARAMKTAMEILEPRLIAAGFKPMATVVVGTVKGDVHDIGKNLVAMMLKGAGFNVVDLGTNVDPEQFVQAARKHGAKAAGLSALLTTTMPVMGQTVTAFQQAGMDVKVMIGGASVTQQYADTIGAHGYAPDATSAVDLVKQLLGA
jgi:5-methyltetrahydrofolate--homocysteine methyltransferase